MKQLKSMFDKTRLITTIVLLAAIATVLVCGILGGILAGSDESINPIFTILVIVGIIVVYCAYFWYSLSYIPFGRKIVCKCFKKGTEEVTSS